MTGSREKDFIKTFSMPVSFRIEDSPSGEVGTLQGYCALDISPLDSKGKDIGIGMDFFSAAKERLNSAKVEVNTEVNPGSAGVNTGKSPMTSEDVQATQKIKEQIRQKEVGLAKAMRLQALHDEEDARQVHLDALLAKRIQEEQELSEQQQKRKAEVQEAAQFYTEEDWDTIRAKLEANAELTKSLQGENVSSDDFAKRMVDMINQKKNSWKMAQLKKLTFEELKVEFEKLMRSIESFVPMGSEERVKRAGVQLEQESSKKQKIAVEDVPVIEEKVEVHEAEEDMEALVKGNDTDSSSGTDIPVSVVPVAIKPPSIANWKIIKLGNKGVYQIIREDGTYITYINFGAMLKSISRDDLTELYRLVMQKYGTNGPEDEYERVFWGDLKTMFDPPLKQTATAKEILNLLIADSLLKTISCDAEVQDLFSKGSNTFLYDKIEEEVYVCQPPGFEEPDNPDKVYKVVKALYGLHQAPRAWYETLAKYLLDNGFHRGKIDQTLFIKKQKGDILLVQVYVDDIIFGSTKKKLCIEFEKLMHDKFQMSSMGELTFFLDVRTASTPMDTEKPLIIDLDGDDVDVHLYRFQVTPKVSHSHAVRRIFRYLKGQPKLGLWYPRDSPFDLVAYSDSDYAGASLDRKSTIGGCQFL
ncbi:putative ribonuclease H-like domain-containing protein [Tanacetum coccineum]